MSPAVVIAQQGHARYSIGAPAMPEAMRAVQLLLAHPEGIPFHGFGLTPDAPEDTFDVLGFSCPAHRLDGYAKPAGCEECVTVYAETDEARALSVLPLASRSIWIAPLDGDFPIRCLLGASLLRVIAAETLDEPRFLVLDPAGLR